MHRAGRAGRPVDLRTRRPAGVALALATVSLLWATLGGVGTGTGVGSVHGTPFHLPSRAALDASRPGSPGWAVHRSVPGEASRDVRVASGGGGTNYTVCNSNLSSGWEAPCFNYTLPAGGFCAPMPLNATLANTGLNLSVASTPASGYGPAPTTFTWNVSVNGGGLPPYLVQLFVYNAASFYNTTNRSGSIQLTQPGLYAVDVLAEDSSCSQTAMVAFALQVYGSLGPFPLHIAPSLTGGTVPVTVSYRVNTSGLPPNVTISWLTGGTFGQSGPAGIANLTYFVPGTYSATACLTLLDAPGGDTTGIDLACNSSAPVVLTGSLPVTTAVTVGSGAYPVPITYSVTVRPNATLPSNTSLYLIAYDSEHVGTAVETAGTTLNLTVDRGCGAPWTTYVAPSGNCTFEADWSLLGPLGGVDAGFLGLGGLFANLTANGSPTLWNPAVAWSHGPLNGSLPLNLTVNVTVSGGFAPYSYSYTVYGRSSGAANATLYPTLNDTVYGWNGSAASIVVPLSRSGAYFASYFVADSNDNWVAFALPLIVLGNVSPLAPLSVHPGGGGGGGPVSSIPAGGSATFEATPTGGRAPYTIQWAFGDGAFGSSAPGELIAHVYTSAGTYRPTVTVTDARGVSVESRLPPVTVTPTPDTGTISVGAGNAAPAPSRAVTALGIAGGLALLLTGAGVLSARRELRAQGEALARSLEEAGGADRGRSPRRP